VVERVAEAAGGDDDVGVCRCSHSSSLSSNILRYSVSPSVVSKLFVPVGINKANKRDVKRRSGSRTIVCNVPSTEAGGVQAPRKLKAPTLCTDANTRVLLPGGTALTSYQVNQEPRDTTPEMLLFNALPIRCESNKKACKIIAHKGITYV
jgi:hypothetical protein